MTYTERLRQFEAEVAKLKLHPAVNSIVFNDGSDHDYQVFAYFNELYPGFKLGDVTRNVKKMLDTIPGVRVYAHYSPQMTYEAYLSNEGRKIQAGYDYNSIKVNLYYYPEE